jgi:hypothetical protein
MKTKGTVLDMIITFITTLVIAILVTLFWNMFIEKKGAIVDWRISFTMAIILGIVIPFSKSKRS